MNSGSGPGEDATSAHAHQNGDSDLPDARTPSPSSPSARPSQLTGPQSATPSPRRAPATSGWRYTFSSLAHRDFMLLWLGMLFMMGGMQMQMLVRLYLVYDITESAKILGLVSAASALPILGLGTIWRCHCRPGRP